MKKYIKYMSMAVMLFALTACSGETNTEVQPVPETPVSTPDISMIEDPSAEEDIVEQQDVYFPDSGAQFSLSPEEEALYEQLKAELTSDLLEGVDPISIAKIYVQAGIDCEWEVEWALFAEDTITRDKDSYREMSEAEKEMYTQESRQGAANWYFPYLDEAVFEEDGDNGVLKFYQATGEEDEPYADFESEFKFQKNDKGIWEVVFNPLV